jgi:hypothetical protein
VIAHRATLDVPGELAQFTAKLLHAERRRRGTPRDSRALTCFRQAVLGLRWFRDRTAPDALARDHGISRATAYRYLDEVIAVLADEAPDLRAALERARAEGFPHVILDGTVIPGDPLVSRNASISPRSGRIGRSSRRRPRRSPESFRAWRRQLVSCGQGESVWGWLTGVVSLSMAWCWSPGRERAR